jgi:hypothetical protein
MDKDKLLWKTKMPAQSDAAKQMSHKSHALPFYSKLRANLPDQFIPNSLILYVFRQAFYSKPKDLHWFRQGF